MANITFNNHGITAVLDETAINKTAMDADDPRGDGTATRFRNAVYHEVFSIEPFDYTDASVTTTFNIGIGSVTVPTELVAAVPESAAEIQTKLDDISARMAEKYPAA